MRREAQDVRRHEAVAAVLTTNLDLPLPEPVHELLAVSRAWHVSPSQADASMRVRIAARDPDLARRFCEAPGGAILDAEARAIDGFERIDPGKKCGDVRCGNGTVDPRGHMIQGRKQLFLP